jgi:cytoskeletal protein CcmA (bactofilin family)
MAAHLNPESIEQTASRLGRHTRFNGTLRFTQSVTIYGEYQGRIEAEGLLYIAAGATVRADARAEQVIVGGVLHGNLEAPGEVELLAGCVMYGNIRAGKIRIADGVVFEGRCEMVRNSESLDVFSAPLEQLRRQAIPIIESPEASSKDT